MWEEFNLNCAVKVKLTDLGVEVLRRKHNRLNETLKRFNPKVELDEFKLYLDEDGYYKTQCWMLIQDFGEAMQGIGEQPFGMSVLIENRCK